MAIDRREHEQFLTEPVVVDPAKNTERFDLNEYEQAALMALLRLLVKEGGRFEYAAQLLLWTFEANSCIEVADEGIEACLDGYVKWSEIDLGL